MTPSKACEALIKSFEQCRLSAYMPTPKDRPTIGWGTTGPDIHMGLTWTQQQADTRFQTDLNRFANSVEAMLAGATTTQGQFDACVSLAYNIGAENFRSSTLRRLHLAGKNAEAAAQFDRWNKQAGVVLRGLTRRRAAERAMYEGKA